MKNQEKYHFVITAEHKLLDLKLRDVWRYRDLIILFTKRDFAVRYKQTVLGPAWLFINPIISSLIYCFIFNGIAGIGTGGVPQMLFYMSGTAIWTFFSGCVTKNATTFTSNAAVFGKVYFPRLTTSIANVFTSVIEFAVQMIIVAAFLCFYLIMGEVSPNWHMLVFIPLVLIHLGIMGLGCGIIISSLTTKYRDLSILVGFAVQLWMYITPVVYPLSQAKDEWLKTILLINPVTTPIEVYRYPLLGEGSINPLFLIISFAFAVFVAWIGIIIFNKVEKNFMDTV